MNWLSLTLGVGVVILGAAPAASQPWRYVDKRGSVHYTSNPHELPPKERAKALAQLEAEAERRAAARAAQPEPAKGLTVPTSEGLPPPVAAPVILDGPAKGAPKPDPVAAWRERQEAAQARVKAARAAVSAAEQAAARAAQTAFNMPSGPAFAANEAAQEALKVKRAALIDADAEVAKVQQADPRGYQRR